MSLRFEIMDKRKKHWRFISSIIFLPDSLYFFVLDDKWRRTYFFIVIAFFSVITPWRDSSKLKFAWSENLTNFLKQLICRDLFSDQQEHNRARCDIPYIEKFINYCKLVTYNLFFINVNYFKVTRKKNE